MINIFMQYQTYENSYRVRNHWHFIDSLTPKKIILPQPKNSPNNAEKLKNKNIHSPHSPSTRQQSPASESRDRIAKMKDKSLVSRIKKEKDKQLASKQHISKQSNSRNQQRTQMMMPKEESSQSYLKDQSNKRVAQLFPKGKSKNGEINKIKQQNEQKTPILKPKKQQTTPTPKRRGSQPFPENDETPPPIKKVKFDAKARSKSVSDQYLSSPIQKYLYLSIQDERRIAGIYQRIKKLRVLDSPK